MKINIKLTQYYCLFILIIYNQFAYSQKNIIKGFVLPPVNLRQISFGSLSLGYERNITNNSSIGLTINIWYADNYEDGLDRGINNYSYLFENLILDYRKYIRKENKKILNNCYGNIYSIFIFNSQYIINGGAKRVGGYEIYGKHLGLGFAAGKKIYITKKQQVII